ncbi:MAG: DUF2399 domain-containing protein [Treponema sp.]|jgi:hypothetical protein|nr:DUF2399 domain-containing protein [Treponema sp.]
MTAWERRIIGAFTGRYPASAAAAIGPASVPAGQGPEEEAPPVKAPRPLRIRPDRIFPGIDRAPPDDRESFLEAAESLEKRGLISLVWARHRKGEILSALVCRKAELLYEYAGEPSPRTGAETVRNLAETLAAKENHRVAAFLSFLAGNFTPLDAAGGIDLRAVEDLARLIRFLFDQDLYRPEHIWRKRVRGLTTRALSTALYGDSKRLEFLLNLFNPLLNRARRQGVIVPDFSLLDRSFPETFIAGNITLDFAGSHDSISIAGNILGLPLETILKLRRIQALSPGEDEEEAAVLMIENKETFFVLSESLRGYACFLYAGGHPNRAVRALVRLLAESGFRFYHAGDLDPDGILILQELAEIAEKTVVPLRMDADTFDRYRGCARKLEPPVLRRTALIDEATRSIPGMAELIRRIEETGMGVEQEIIDYRCAFP